MKKDNIVTKDGNGDGTDGDRTGPDVPGIGLVSLFFSGTDWDRGNNFWLVPGTGRGPIYRRLIGTGNTFIGRFPGRYGKGTHFTGTGDPAFYGPNELLSLKVGSRDFGDRGMKFIGIPGTEINI